MKKNLLHRGLPTLSKKSQKEIIGGSAGDIDGAADGYDAGYDIGFDDGYDAGLGD